MKNRVFWMSIFSLLSLAHTLTWGEGVWHPPWLPVRPWSRLGFHDAYFTNPQRGWIVGASKDVGFIAHKEGEGWRIQLCAPRFYPMSVQFLTKLEGWVAGYRQREDKRWEGFLLRTEDGGENWIDSHRFPYRIYQLQFVTPRKGWFIGTENLPDNTRRSAIYMTEDGGESWGIQYKGSDEILASLCFIDPTIGWVLGVTKSDWKSFLLHTRDGGESWERLRPNLKGFIAAIDFVEAEKGWAVEIEDEKVGDKVVSYWNILHTEDGGRSWARQKRGKSVITWKSKIWFADEREGWVVTGGTILHTDDGGKVWEVQDYRLSFKEFEYKMFPGGIYFLDDKVGWIVGSGILYTTDGGMSWRQEPHRVMDELDMNGVFFVTRRRGWVVGEGGAIFHTTDGGLTWQRQESMTDVELYGIHFISRGKGWVVGDEGTILHTKDGGGRWERQRSHTEIPLYDVQFLNEKEGWAVGGIFRGKGIILHTTDGGERWKIIQDLPIRPGCLKQVHFVNPKTGWVAGVGPILHTEDGGRSWRRQSITGVGSPYVIYFLDELRGWGAGWSGMVNGKLERGAFIAVSEDGGYNWEVQFHDQEMVIKRIYFANRYEGWAFNTGKGDAILYTRDGGRSWGYQYSLSPGGGLRDICYGGKGTLWAVGRRGVLLRYYDPNLQVTPPSYWAVEPRGKEISLWGEIKQGGKRPIASAPVLRNQLHQNYPNPFNLETWIPFQLAGESEVIIRIYDVQGGLVRELLLGRRKAGYYLDKQHAARWDGRDEMGVAVPSGMYFYTLTAKGYTATRKLVLIK
jgi:photosystem II stability/assembly factor-like uncharacterized protein